MLSLCLFFVFQLVRAPCPFKWTTFFYKFCMYGIFYFGRFSNSNSKFGSFTVVLGIFYAVYLSKIKIKSHNLLTMLMKIKFF